MNDKIQFKKDFIYKYIFNIFSPHRRLMFKYYSNRFMARTIALLLAFFDIEHAQERKKNTFRKINNKL